MVNSILIGKTIYKLLTSSDELKKYVKNKIYPLVADDGVTFPFVIYYRTKINNLSNKDGYFEDEVGFTIITVSKSYIESLEIANIIRSIFEKKKLTEDIYNCTVEDIDEDYRENAYIQQIYFNCKMENNNIEE